jgi:peptidoglycan/xylan/chitin deacetylase (PgdA/CDA1 family)
MLLAAMLLSACAAGAPTVASDPTPSKPAVAAVEPTATARSPESATQTPIVDPAPVVASPTPDLAREATAEPEATERPEPPPDPGTGASQVYERADTGRAEVALTFDAGADRGNTELILDTLDAYGIKASFGVTGEWAQANPDLIERIVADGHMVFNHTWSHRSFTGFSTDGWDEGVLTTDERRREVADTEDVVRELTGYRMLPYFRPPYGDLDDGVLRDLYEFGYRITLMWTCDSLGWNGADPAAIIENCGASASPGDIILLHVGSDSTDAEALPGLIESLLDLGLQPVTIEELLQGDRQVASATE